MNDEGKAYLKYNDAIGGEPIGLTIPFGYPDGVEQMGGVVTVYEESIKQGIPWEELLHYEPIPLDEADLGGGNMDITGGSGAISRFDIVRQSQHAKLFYDEVRKRTGDIDSITNNTDFSKEDIKTIKEHVFFNAYALGDEMPTRFDPDYDMAVSWQRLTEGKAIQEMDLVLLHHELMECKLMKEEGLSYREAHAITEKIYNYKKYVDELDRRGLHE